ncbi:MAG: tRNA pseudouridine(38-40) synthase TruA [Verrucomicrobiota bacterium]
MTRWKVTCAYDGTDYSGWQSQADGSAVQNFIEGALSEVLRDSIKIHGASRTDSGVHANGQCFHFDFPWNHNGEALCRAVNTKLPASIRIEAASLAPDDFHARHSNIGKSYKYRFSTRPPNPFSIRYCWHIEREFRSERITKVLKEFEGTHDFTAFAGKVHPQENPVKSIRSVKLISEGNSDWCLEVSGSGFLYRMVRSMAGSLIRVASGKLSADRIAELLEEKVRTTEVYTAPACGLFLEEVFYP